MYDPRMSNQIPGSQIGIPIPLTEIKEGSRIKVQKVKCNDNVKHRLCSLGILNGQQIEMISNDTNSPIIIKVFDSKIAIGREQARHISVILA